MKRAIVIVGVFALFLTIACTSRKKEQELDRRQAELNQKEQELLLKERTLQLKEDELAQREKSIDSIPAKDTIALNNNPELAGSWLVKMTCIETSCTGSAVGDTKTEQWELEYQGDHIIAKANVSDKLVRVYSGLASQNRLELVEHKDSTSSTNDTHMLVQLRVIDKKIMEGQREIIRKNNCKILYSLRMDKL